MSDATPTITRAEWDRMSNDYKLMIDGKPFMLYMKHGKTVLGPVIITPSK